MTMVMSDCMCVQSTYIVLYAHSKVKGNVRSHCLRLVAIGYEYGMLP